MVLLLAAIVFSLPQTIESGAVVGTIPAVQQRSATAPREAVTVALLPTKYAELWKRTTQQRLDAYWETYKPQFALRKELFLDFNRIAQRDSLRETMDAMRRDLGERAGDYIKQSAVGDKFEFKNLPFGTYRLVAIGSEDPSTLVWTTSVEVRDNVPVFVTLGKPAS